MTWISYAQNFEDVTLMRALGHLPVGFYIDVGAHHPTADSVTRAFYERGWCGINIEPVPGSLEAFEQQRPRDVNLGWAIADQPGSLRLHEVVGTGLSTLQQTQADEYRREGLTVTPHEVAVHTLNEVCHAHAADREIHFLKIDVEGAEEAALRGLDLARFRPWVIVVEATRPRSAQASHQDWEGLILGRGYRLAWFDGLNRFYVAEEREGLQRLLARRPACRTTSCATPSASCVMTWLNTRGSSPT